MKWMETKIETRMEMEIEMKIEMKMQLMEGNPPFEPSPEESG